MQEFKNFAVLIVLFFGACSNFGIELEYKDECHEEGLFMVEVMHEDGTSEFKCLPKNVLYNFYATSGQMQLFLECYIDTLPVKAFSTCSQAGVGYIPNLAAYVYTNEHNKRKLINADADSWLRFSTILVEDICQEEVFIEFMFVCEKDNDMKNIIKVDHDIESLIYCDAELVKVSDDDPVVQTFSYQILPSMCSQEQEEE